MPIKTMNKILSAILAGFFVFNFSLVYADEPSFCYPPYWGGLLPGESGEREALKLYGAGLYRDYGYARVRYYYNKNKTHTLVLYFGTDNFITDIFVHKGKKYPRNEKINDITPYVVDWFNPYEGFGTWHKLKIGASKEEVTKWLGNPYKVISEQEWEYQSKCACELPTGINVIFKSNKVVSVRFWASQG